jgi:hypothetical protein
MSIGGPVVLAAANTAYGWTPGNFSRYVHPGVGGSIPITLNAVSGRIIT